MLIYLHIFILYFCFLLPDSRFTAICAVFTFQVSAVDVDCTRTTSDLTNCRIYPSVILNFSDAFNFIIAPDRTHNDIINLRFWDSNLFFVPAQVYTTFPELRKLELGGNISVISKSDFPNASKITSLSLIGNKIERIPPQCFYQFPH